MLYISKNNSTIEDSNYNFFSVNGFFGINDHIRLTILSFILLSLILNIIIFTILLKRKKTKKTGGFSLSGILTFNILTVNFIHNLSYIFNWVIKDNTTEYRKDPDKPGLNVGALLIGSPSKYYPCIFQGFLLIFFSMSQDFIINIFFAFVNMEGKEKRFPFIIVIAIIGYIFPFFITLIYVNFALIGINEKVCYIAKYTYKIDKNGKVKYFPEKNYDIFKAIIFIIRGINYFITLLFGIRAIRYIKRSKKKDKKVEKLLSSLPVIAIVFFTLSIYLIFRIIFFMNSRLEEKYMDIYLILNSVDAVLLPIVFFINHGIYRYFCCCCPKIQYENDNYDNETSIKDDIILDNLMPKNENKEDE